MLSKKMAFSLTSLITILALAFVVSPAMGVVLGDGFKTTLSLDHTTDTTSTTQPTPFLIADNVIEAGGPIRLKVVFDKRIPSLLTGDDLAGADGTENEFTTHDITVTAKNENAGDVTAVPATIAAIADKGNKEFTFTLGTIEAVAFGETDATGVITVEVKVLANRVKNDDISDRIQVAQNPGDSLGYNAEGALKFTIVPTVTDRPTATIDAARAPAIVLGPTVHPSFSVKVTTSVVPKDKKLTKDHIDVKNATVSDVVKIDDTNYTVVIMPKYESKDDIEIRVKPYESNALPRTKSVLTAATKVKVNSDANKKIGLVGTTVALDKDSVIPVDGYLVVAKDKDLSLIIDPGGHDQKAADIARRADAKKQTYNLIEKDLGINLEGFLIRGGTIDLVSPSAGLVISEIMWATDGGGQGRQWIEIHNTSAAAVKLGDKTTKFMLYEANETPPDMSVAANNIQDRVSTLYKGTNHWSIAGKGQSGRSSDIVTLPQQDFEVVPTSPLVSMERAMMTDGMYADGTMEGSWGSSMPPSQNFTDAAGAHFVGSPGASPINPVADPPAKPIEATPDPAMVAESTDIMITEIMVDTGNGRLPQWIELNNVSGKEVSLEGWSVQIENAAADTDVIGSDLEIHLMGTLGVSAHAGNTGKGNSLLLVSRAHRSSANLEGNKNIIDVSSDVGARGHYKLISDMAFLITLWPPQKSGVLTPGDMAGNLDANPAWEIPMDEAGRSSLIRHEMDAGMATMGTAANGWVLASDTTLTDGPATWYGSDEDAGTPGYDAGGPLPVELSHFRPARDKATGQVVITWATQSELNNAGFFIKRSNQKDGEFKVINATMIAGAGTTSEKQFYTFTDTTAQPNIVYYYQIEDVSLDGQRQTLTRGIRLKGHIGAAGKLTSTWGEIKASNE